jgi:iron(III) transport system substrate-binding protein
VASDRRQQLEWLVRGRYPIGAAVSKSAITEIQQQGVGRNVMPLAFDTPLGARLSFTRTVALFNRAPHPNAAKVYLNWILSREGQQLYVQYLDEASRRLDVEGPRDRLPDPGVQYPGSVNKEAYNGYERRAIEIAREVLR